MRCALCARTYPGACECAVKPARPRKPLRGETHAQALARYEQALIRYEERWG